MNALIYFSEPNTASKVSENIEWSHQTASAIDQFTTRFYSKVIIVLSSVPFFLYDWNGRKEALINLLNLQYVEQKGPDANLVFSPFSIHLALAMLTAAATTDSTTQSELFDVMGGINNIKELQNSYKSLLDEYKVSTVFEIYIQYPSDLFSITDFLKFL